MNGKFKATRHFLLAVTFVATSVLSAFAQISPCLVEADFVVVGGGIAGTAAAVAAAWQFGFRIPSTDAGERKWLKPVA